MQIRVSGAIQRHEDFSGSYWKTEEVEETGEFRSSFMRERREIPRENHDTRENAIEPLHCFLVTFKQDLHLKRRCQIKISTTDSLSDLYVLKPTCTITSLALMCIFVKFFQSRT